MESKNFSFKSLERSCQGSASYCGSNDKVAFWIAMGNDERREYPSISCHFWGL